MKIVKEVAKKIETEELGYKYSYRLTANKFEGKEIFGVEVERFDYLDGELVNIERDGVEKISHDVLKVSELFDIISESIVSPIHLIDVIGDKIDRCIEEINEERAMAYN
ncbi:DUF6514 family protein [uncultured Clostridium sp.]|uniref:DUF6514 family protein n=1 Tax=uncultured Clostridium sp. TaxID=59620 RepID=UPI002601A0F0|nr:DUF6514 family protein [uncultured Clostridium sp.]